MARGDKLYDSAPFKKDREQQVAKANVGTAVEDMLREEDNASDSRLIDRGINKYSPSEGMGDPDKDDPKKVGPRGPGIGRPDEADDDDYEEMSPTQRAAKKSKKR